jgi:hypothetical protein
MSHSLVPICLRQPRSQAIHSYHSGVFKVRRHRPADGMIITVSSTAAPQCFNLKFGVFVGGPLRHRDGAAASPYRRAYRPPLAGSDIVAGASELPIIECPRRARGPLTRREWHAVAAGPPGRLSMARAATPGAPAGLVPVAITCIPVPLSLPVPARSQRGMGWPAWHPMSPQSFELYRD